MTEHDSTLSSLVEAALSSSNLQRLALQVVQERHLARLQDSVILEYAANLAELPVTDRLHICVFSHAGVLSGIYTEVGGIRFKDLAHTDAREIFVPVYSREGEEAIGPFDTFGEGHAFMVADMVAELALRNGVDFHLRPDLTELATL